MSSRFGLEKVSGDYMHVIDGCGLCILQLTLLNFV